MKRLTWLAMIAWAAAACGGDDEVATVSDAGANRPDAVVTTVTDPNACIGTFSDYTHATLGSQFRAGGMCASASDVEVLCSVDVEATTRGCGGNCYLQNTAATKDQLLRCIHTCLQGALAPSPSAGCVSCYETAAACTIATCLRVCAPNPSSAECKQCEAMAGCDRAFRGCSGVIDRSDADGGADDASAPADGG
jgi:hypothetical protein